VSSRFIAVDTNLLLYAYDSLSHWHEPARRCLGALAAAAEPWAIPWPCVHEFLAYATHAKLVRSPTAVEDALAQVEIWTEAPTLRLLTEGAGHWPELRGILTAGALRGGQVHDARIAAICREHGVSELWSADRDFSRVRGLRTRNPLLA
jgi:toxin-antitoxin system PIN domain toxin